jgi:two-component system sensor histidine kinase HydH
VTSKRSGTGLGLAISRRLAEEHGGQLTATNDPRGGAAFTLRLPTLG